MKKLSFPSPFLLLFFLIVLVAMLTWIIPAGSFDRHVDPKSGYTVITNGTYHAVKSHHQGFIEVMSSFCMGIIDSAEVIAYVLLIGGAYGVILKTRAIESGFNALVHKMGSNKVTVLIPFFMILFSVGGTITGTWEETLAFYLILVPLMLASGYDAMVGAAIIIVGAGTGVLASTLNPFSIGIGSSIAGISLQDGLNIRLISYSVLVPISILYVMRYAYRVKKDPKKSLVYDLKESHDKYFSNIDVKDLEFSVARKLITIMYIIMIISMIVSIALFNWWIPQMSMLFLVMAMFSAVVTKMGEKQFWNNFVEGAKDFVISALIIGLARGVVIVAKDGMIIDTILYYIQQLQHSISKDLFLVVNLVVQMGIAVLIPSSSAHTALSIPILASAADTFSIPRDVIIMSLQYSSGLINLITPTAGVLIAGLYISKIPYSSWLKFIIPLLIIQFIVIIILLNIFTH